MMGDRDCTSDLDEELPVFTCLQPAGHSSRTRQRSPEKPDTAGSEPSTIPCSEARDAGAHVGRAPAVMMISSDSDDDVPYVPLAQRLKHRQNSSISSSAGPNGKGAEQCLPSKPTGSHQVKQTTQAEFESVPPAQKKTTKRTAEEIEASRRRRQVRDRQQQDKETLRQQEEREKAERRALAEAARALRPEQCIKHVVVAVDPALLQLEGGGVLLASVQALGCSCVIEQQALPRSVSWARTAPSTQLDEGRCEPETQVVMQMTVDNFITLIHNYIQEARHGRSDCGPTLTSWIQQQQRRHPNKTLSLAVIELDNYFREVGYSPMDLKLEQLEQFAHEEWAKIPAERLKTSHSRRRFREAVEGEETRGGKEKKKRKKDGAEALPEVSRLDVEEALVHLQLHTNVSVQFSSTWKDFSDYIAMTTKAVAEAPFKRAREKTGFSFCLESECAGGQRVDRAGKGLLQVWKRQIQQLNRVSPDVAAAVLAAYPSPQLLRKAYSRCRTEGQKVSLLSELLIRRGEGITSTTRRVGPELSKRLYLMMHSQDPEHILDVSL